MRLALVATLALLPSAAFAQTGSPSLQASVSQPNAFLHAAATPSATASSTAGSTSATPAAEPPAAEAPLVARYRDVIVKEQLSSPAMDQLLAQDGGISYTLNAGGVSSSRIVAPIPVHTIGRTLPVSSVVSTGADVTVALMVDSQGLPHDISIVHSGGEAVDKGTIQAVEQFRFKPATYQNEPVSAHLTLEIKVKK